MSYQTLYRKYRPKSLKNVYGQDIIVKILTNAIESNRFAHAYLFTGPRGCGKTSIAKIVARMINCENLIDNEPCNKCSSCLESVQDNCVDIIEIDAASNNGVDEIRELKNNATILPSSLKYKIYIIDEVHMLSTGAFNALLKTLEEPPEHVVFILATTDLDKVPVTIISRCQVLEFKKINKNDMFNRLKEISKLEKIRIDDDAINEIIDQSDGGLRDAIGLLDLASSYSADKISSEDISTINGNISMHEISELTKLIINHNISESIDKINVYYNGGKDLFKITSKIIKQLNLILMDSNNTNVCSIYEIMLEALSNMKKNNLDSDYLMLALYKIDLLNNNEKDEKVDAEIFYLSENKDVPNEKEDSDKKEVIVTENITKKKTTVSKILDIKNTRVNNTFVDADKEVLKKYKNKWNELDNYTLDRKYGAYVCELIDVVPVVASKDYLVLTHKYDSFVDKGNSNINNYEDVIKKILKEKVKLVFITEKEWNIYKKEYIENTSNGIKYQPKEEIVEQIESIEETIEEHDIIKKANELFDNIEIEIEE